MRRPGSPPKPIETLHMKIRPSHSADAAQIAGIYAPFCGDSPVSFEIAPPDAFEMAGRIERISRQFPWLVADENGTIAGYAYASPHRERAAYRWSADVTVYIHERFRRRGVGRALYSSLFALLRIQGYFKAYAGITVPNPGSTGLHAAMGFELVGIYREVGYKAGAWHDVSWWALALQPLANPPLEPRAFPEIAGLAESLEAFETGEKMFTSAS
jgi:phosphinothricin acetyltransferase